MLNLDIRSLEFGSGGLEPFCFPVQRDELVRMENAMTSMLAKLAREEERADPVGAAFAAVAKAVTLEALSCFFADLLVRRSPNIISQPSSRVIRALADGRRPSNPPFLANLAEGVGEAAWKRLSRPFKAPFSKNAVKPAWPFALGRQGTCIIAMSPLIEYELGNVRGRKGYVPLSWWLHGPVSATPFDRRATRARIEDHFGEAVTAAYAAVGERANMLVSDHLTSTGTAAVALATTRCRQLDRARRSLPRRLWSGTGGDTWVRLFRSAVRRHGGFVRGHDHGSGGGHLKMPHYSHNEFFECDEFVTFSKAQADGVRDFNVIPDFLFEPDHVPVVRGASGWKAETPLVGDPGRPGRKTVIHVGMPLTGEQVVGTPLMFDYVMVDWYARLLTRVAGMGYRVVHKAYPSASVEPILGRLERLGVEIDRRPLELALSRGDTVLFDHASTTTFGHTLRTSLPVVLVDFGILPFNERAQPLLSRRCAIIKGRFDESGRAQVDWDALRDGLETACDHNDRTYPVEYLGAAN